jgi:leucyl/phenylalanyl-tRNA--protein transferase
MPVYELYKDILIFPDVNESEQSGLIAVGGDLSVNRLLLAYRSGIFPWYSSLPIKWYSPDPRMVLFLDEFYTGKSLRKVFRKKKFEITFDLEFSKVMNLCGKTRILEGTWITEEMLQAYSRMHEKGFAHSVEVWCEEELVGGLYGVQINKMFYGESMFHIVPDASKFAMLYLAAKLNFLGIEFIDCQVYTENLARFGAIEIPRNEYMQLLKHQLQIEIENKKWNQKFDEQFIHRFTT